MHKALCAAFDEATPESYNVDQAPQSTPAYIFVWQSTFFTRKMFLKFKLLGTRKKPVLWLYSCHEAYF